MHECTDSFTFGLDVLGICDLYLYGLIQIEHNAAAARKKAKEQELKSNKFWNYIDD